MTQWEGFDQRKVCPNCKGYHTKLSQLEREQNSRSNAILAIIVLSITFIVTGALAALFFRQLTLGQSPHPALVLPFIILIVNLIFNRSLKDGVKESHTLIFFSKPGETSPGTLNFYHLHCMDCGHTWEKPADEWEAEARNESSNQ